MVVDSEPRHTQRVGVPVIMHGSNNVGFASCIGLEGDYFERVGMVGPFSSSLGWVIIRPYQECAMEI
jgi:hypothetical protein